MLTLEVTEKRKLVNSDVLTADVTAGAGAKIQKFRTKAFLAAGRATVILLLLIRKTIKTGSDAVGTDVSEDRAASI